MTLPPSVSIVIPAYNEQDTIRACLTAALDQTVPAAEIIVVDNRSTDGTAAIVRGMQQAYPDAPIILFHQDEEQGLVPTRNFGLDRAQGDVLGRIDADSVIEPNWVEEVQRMFADPEVAAGTGPVIYYDMPLRRFGHKADDALRRSMIKLAREYRLLFGSNMAIRRTAWQVIRDAVCRDEADEFHEDIDISVHLREHLLRVAYSSAMVAGMSARRMDDTPRQYYQYVTRFERTFKSHGIRSVAVRAPMVVFLAIYPPVNAWRRQRARRAAALAR